MRRVLLRASTPAALAGATLLAGCAADGLASTQLTLGATRTVTLVGGGAAFLRVGVPANGARSVAWGTLPANVQMTVVRTR